MPAGVQTTNFTSSSTVDELLGNHNGSTVRLSLDRLVGLVGSRIGPTYATLAQLDADLAWDAGSLAVVWSDPDASKVGLYEKSGASGSGTWARVGNAPLSIAMEAAQNSAAAAAASEADAAISVGHSQAAAAASGVASQQAENFRDQILALANSGAFDEVFETRAIADAAATGLADGSKIAVLADENMGGISTFYTVSSGALVYQTWLWERGYQHHRFLPKLAKKLLQVQTATTQLNVVHMFDSVAGDPTFVLGPYLSARMYSSKVWNAPGATTNLNAYPGGCDIIPETGHGETTLSDQYDVWYKGSLFQYPAGVSPLVRMSGAPFHWTEVKFFYIVDNASGGIVQMQKDDGAGWVDIGPAVDTSAGTDGEIGFFSISQGSSNNQPLRMVISGGVYKWAYAFMRQSDVNRVHWHGALNQGGLGIADAMQYTQARANLQTVLGEVAPDLVTFAGRETEATLGSHVGYLFDILDTTGADVVVMAGLPIPNSGAEDADARAQNAILISQCRTRRASGKNYCYLDTYTPFMLDYNPDSAAGWLVPQGTDFTSGGVHQTVYGLGTFVAYKVMELVEYVGGMAGGYPRPPWTTQPGLLGIGTRIEQSDGLGFEFYLENTYDGRLRLPRSLKFVIDQSYAGSEYWQIGSHLGGGEQATSVEPVTLTFGQYGSGFYRNQTDYGGELPVWRWYDDTAENYTGRMFFQLGGVFLNPVAKADADILAGGSIAQLDGTLISINYGTKKGIAAARGGGSGAWAPLARKVSVPVNSSIAAAPGDWAADGNYIYVYTGDGNTAHSWVRSAAATW
ncbi:hypothetical protein FGK63_01710 [Ruegeria sediminis]|uniref:SGNH/GDSL hydrolase family protein n=1 Tax=Ruegeria sediminis TaxID=2583820 RepID=A0ABY2X353_9RHOB|nr:hypothetical protein [Ruegeria sediminis]TMV09812.1 hypothetical protein FGK63_01710 [Ruegeria sediminis]